MVHDYCGHFEEASALLVFDKIEFDEVTRYIFETVLIQVFY